MSTPLTTAMIFAAGRGERMRPLTDTCPKPLLEAGGKPLIVWQIEALARAGIDTIVINHAWLGEQIEAALGDGARWGVRLAYSAEGDALETAGGIAQALPLIERDGQPTVFAAVSGDVYCAFDYRTLAPRAARMAGLDTPAMHLVMVPNPPFHPAGDFALGDDQLALQGRERFARRRMGRIRLRRGFAQRRQILLEIGERLELLRLLPFGGDALRARARGDERAGADVEREGELRRGGRARGELVIDEPHEAEHRVAQRGRAQERLVGDALLIEGEHVGDGGP